MTEVLSGSTTQDLEGIEGRLAEWEGVGVVVRRDGPTGTWIFVVLDDDTLVNTISRAKARR